MSTVATVTVIALQNFLKYHQFTQILLSPMAKEIGKPTYGPPLPALRLVVSDNCLVIRGRVVAGIEWEINNDLPLIVARFE